MLWLSPETEDSARIGSITTQRWLFGILQMLSWFIVTSKASSGQMPPEAVLDNITWDHFHWL